MSKLLIQSESLAVEARVVRIVIWHCSTKIVVFVNADLVTFFLYVFPTIIFIDMYKIKVFPLVDHLTKMY